ncbi:MAG: hypothetical protein ABIV21_02195, partial [Pyrinomonadaceae bacterium]
MSDLFISKETAEQDLLACAAFLAERIKSSDGRGEAMNAVIPRYLARGDVDLAAELANATDEPFSRDKLLLLVAEKCAEIDDDEYALQLTDAIEDLGIQSHAFERVALSAISKGNRAKALEIADSMAHPDLIYAAVAAHQAIEGDDGGSRATLDMIMFPSSRVHALQQVAADRIKSGRAEAATEPLDEAVAAANDIEHSEEKIRNLLDIGNLFIEAEQNDKAVSTFELACRAAEALDNTHRDFFLVNCALGFLYAGSQAQSDTTLDLVTDKTQMASALLAVAREQWKNEEKQQAVDTLEEAYEILKSQREAETRDSRARNTLFASIAAQLAGFGKTDRGVEVALENIDPRERTAALSQIAQILTVQKEDALSRQTMNLIDEDADRLFALLGIADAKVGLGEPDGSIALLDEAATLSETVSQLGARSAILNSIAERYTA